MKDLELIKEQITKILQNYSYCRYNIEIGEKDKDINLYLVGGVSSISIKEIAKIADSNELLFYMRAELNENGENCIYWNIFK